MPRRVCRLSFDRRFLFPATGMTITSFLLQFFFQSPRMSEKTRKRRGERKEERRGVEVEDFDDDSMVKRISRGRCSTYARSLGYQPTNSFATVLHTLTNRGNNENNFSPFFQSPLNDSHCALVPASDFFGCRAARNGGGIRPRSVKEEVASLRERLCVSGMTVRLSARN